MPRTFDYEKYIEARDMLAEMETDEPDEVDKLYRDYGGEEG